MTHTMSHIDDLNFKWQECSRFEFRSSFWYPFGRGTRTSFWIQNGYILAIWNFCSSSFILLIFYPGLISAECLNIFAAPVWSKETAVCIALMKTRSNEEPKLPPIAGLVPFIVWTRNNSCELYRPRDLRAKWWLPLYQGWLQNSTYFRSSRC